MLLNLLKTKSMKTTFPFIVILFSFLFYGCQEIGQPGIRPFNFKVIDNIGNNLIGDSINPNRYHIDSVKSYYKIGSVFKEGGFSIYNDFYTGYNFSGGVSTKNYDVTFLLKYNSLANDTIRVIYPKNKISVYQNNNLIFSKDNLSEIPPVKFSIIK